MAKKKMVGLVCSDCGSTSFIKVGRDWRVNSAWRDNPNDPNIPHRIRAQRLQCKQCGKITIV